MKSLRTNLITGAIIVCAGFGNGRMFAQESAVLTDGKTTATMVVKGTGDLRAYELTCNADMRDNRPPDKRITYAEAAHHARLRTGNVMFDGLYAMAVHEALQNSVTQINDNAYGKGAPIQLKAFQTGELWTYVWTRDLAYSVNLALGGFDPQRAVNSLLFKTSVLKPSVVGGFTNQIIQDTGSGGSYPVSTDRIVWALGASETLKYLDGAEREHFLNQVWPILRDTIEQDRRLVFDPKNGLYRGEQSFLDWREQTYPGWTKDNVLVIAMSKSLSVNAANYFLLKTAGEYAGCLGHRADEARYTQWAAQLKAAINEGFFDAKAGLYSTYLLSDGINDIRVQRYDLLGESLAILFGIADQSKAEAILRNYPVGPHGPAVVWPQERSVPIYHNQAIWPFVTAYWAKAGRKANNAEVVDQGVRSLVKLSAFNLSNMENFDFVTGQSEIKGKALNGPVINSRRQLWSVAGYLSMVQDIVLGLETSWDGIRFEPFITAKLRNETFASSEIIELRNFTYRNTRHQVRVHLPPANALIHGVCAIQSVELNGKKIGNGFIGVTSLEPSNQWDIYLQMPSSPQETAPLHVVDGSNERVLFGPLQPTWDETQQGGITVKNGRLALHYRHADAGNVAFNLYRDGQQVAKGVKQTMWVDPSSADFSDAAHTYTVEAVDLESGNVSHLAPPRRYAVGSHEKAILAKDIRNRGGNLVDGHHFENWGQLDHELATKRFSVSRTGRYQLCTEFSNGLGPVNTGITCAIKKIEVLKSGSNEILTSGYIIMPQSGDWKRWDMSSPIAVQLSAGVEYSICLSEDEYSRNMSYLKNNERYTAWPGGGATGNNYVNIAAFHLLQISNGSYLSLAK